MDNAQNIGDWGDQQMTVANTRIPYQSTAQVESEFPVKVLDQRPVFLTNVQIPFEKRLESRLGLM